MTEWKVYPAAEDRLSRYSRFWIAREFPDGGMEVCQPGSMIRILTPAEVSGPVVAEVAEDVWSLPTAALGPLHAFLGQRLGQFSDLNAVSQLRRDYEAERARVDIFIAHLTRSSP